MTTESVLELKKLDASAMHLAVIADDPDLGLVSRLQQGGRGQADDLLAFDFGAPDDDGAEAHLWRRRGQRHLHLVGARGTVGLG